MPTPHNCLGAVKNATQPTKEENALNECKQELKVPFPLTMIAGWAAKQNNTEPLA